MKILVALAGLLLLVGCRHEEEYVVRDLTTYKPAWKNYDKHFSDTDYHAFELWYLDSMISRALSVSRLNQIEKDTIAVSIYVKKGGWTDFPVPRYFRLTLSVSEGNQSCQFCEGYLAVNPSRIIPLPIKCRAVELKENQASEFIRDLEDRGIWKAHSFLEDHDCGDCNKVFIEIRDRNRYKAIKYHGDWLAMVYPILEASMVNPELVSAIRSEGRSYNPSELDSLGDYNFGITHGRWKQLYENGGFDTDSTWLVE